MSQWYDQELTTTFSMAIREEMKDSYLVALSIVSIRIGEKYRSS